MNQIPTAAIGDEIIEIAQVVSSTKEALRLSAITDYDTSIENFINEGAGKIDSSSTSVQKPALLDICDGNRIKLPKGCQQVIAIRLLPDQVSGDGVEDSPLDLSTLTTGGSSDLLYLSKDYISACGLSGVNNPMLPLTDTFQINQGYIVLTFPLPANASKALVSYIGKNVDCNGMMYLMAKMEIGLRAYACWRMLSIYPELWPRDYFQFYSQRLEAWNREWRLEFRKIIGDDAVKNFIYNRYMIKRVMGALLRDESD